MIAVIIPYFQRESGILRKALASVAAQRDCPPPVHVIVVDDASPVPAEPEVSGFGGSSLTLEVHRQPNGGPGSARNAGLECVPAACRYVAFLDSDDEWSGDHLARAVHALDAGNDFYFANLYQLGQSVDAFSRAGRITPTDHPAIPGPHADLHRYVGDMFDQIMRGNVIGTSTVVYRHEAYRALRFRTDLARAGEDYLFWMSLVQEGVRVAFSSRVEATYGRGVNVYSGAQWASDEFFVRVRNELTYRVATRELFRVTPAQRTHLDDCVRALRENFAGAVVSRLRHGPRLAPKLVFEQLRADPLSAWAIPVRLLRALAGRG